MKIIKNIATILFLLLLCCLCVCCIVFLNNESNSSNSDLDLSEAQENVYSEYSKLFLDYMNLEQIIEVGGRIFCTDGTPLEEVQLTGDTSHVLVSQGDIFHKGDVLFQNGNKTYVAKYDGKVDRIYTAGDKVCLVLANYQNRIICADISFEYAQYIALGDEIHFRYNGENYIGTVSYIATTVTNGCIDFEISFQDEGMDMLLNAPVEIIIVKASVTNVVAIPQYALITSGNEYYVRVLCSNGSNELRSVTIGLVSSDGFVEICEGLTADDIVLFDTSAAINGDVADD